MIRTCVLTIALTWAPAASAAGDCTDYTRVPALRQLEPFASRGALNDEEVRCLEVAFEKANRQTVKNKVSRVLLVHAYVTDTTWWERLVRRHLEDVDQSDPDMAFLYAIHLHLQAEADPDEVVHWAEVALEQRQVWTGDAFVARTLSMLELRAYATARKWTRMADDGSGDRVDEKTGIKVVELLRGDTKTYAREWLDFARAAGRDTDKALELCKSAAQRESACALD
ncbi:MAG: hypothetical protein ACI8PZ_001735 [Myxococcota bacterium]